MEHERDEVGSVGRNKNMMSFPVKIDGSQVSISARSFSQSSKLVQFYCSTKQKLQGYQHRRDTLTFILGISKLNIGSVGSIEQRIKLA